ncbi:MAG: aminoglycoside phosphotransferase family protein [Gammaproteobacteria bacterium]|nr:aminoglycoside phosphotransferase family protein [Gammaproteobacteria bacterium]
MQRRCGPGRTEITNISAIAENFELRGTDYVADVFGSGHIHDTFLIWSPDDAAGQRHILQLINRNVFRQPVQLMDNVGRVIRHVGQKLEQRGAGADRCLSLVRTLQGDDFFVDDSGDYWRMYEYLDGAQTFDVAETTDMAFEAAAAFGRFQELLSDLPPPRLHEVIPDFHDTPRRMQALENAIREDPVDRARLCQPEIEFARTFGSSADELLAMQRAGDIPERVVHNDTKINNVMFDTDTGKAICVIDLDTVMPGLVHFDFGDLARTVTPDAGEDERDAGNVEMRLDMFDALARGYLSSAGSFLNAAEVGSLHLAGRIITAETGVRFLTDFLEGDRYFRADRLYQNLLRCRNQFALAESMKQQSHAMRDIVAAAANELGLSRPPA